MNLFRFNGHSYRKFQSIVFVFKALQVIENEYLIYATHNSVVIRESKYNFFNITHSNFFNSIWSHVMADVSKTTLWVLKKKIRIQNLECKTIFSYCFITGIWIKILDVIEKEFNWHKIMMYMKFMITF